VTPDEMIERVRMALAEAGYPDAHVGIYDHPRGGAHYGWTRFPGTDHARAAWWMVQQVVLRSVERTCCWACYLASSRCNDDRTGQDCSDGNCHNPDGPKLPPRELLRRPS